MLFFSNFFAAACYKFGRNLSYLYGGAFQPAGRPHGCPRFRPQSIPGAVRPGPGDAAPEREKLKKKGMGVLLCPYTQSGRPEPAGNPVVLRRAGQPPAGRLSAWPGRRVPSLRRAARPAPSVPLYGEKGRRRAHFGEKMMFCCRVKSHNVEFPPLALSWNHLLRKGGSL